jgi:hypothetical protein
MQDLIRFAQDHWQLLVVVAVLVDLRGALSKAIAAHQVATIAKLDELYSCVWQLTPAGKETAEDIRRGYP